MKENGMLLVDRKESHIKAEETLKENQRQQSEIINFLPDATLAVDKEKRIIIWNRAIEEMTGVPAEEMIGKGNYAYTMPFHGEARPLLMDLVFEDCEEIATRYPDLSREGDTVMGEVFCKALYNNRGAWVYVKASPLHDQFGNIIGVIECIRDINEKKLAEQALLESEKLYRSLFENLLNGFAYCRMLYENGLPQDFIYLTVNEAFELQTGLFGVEGKKATEIIPGIRKDDPQLFEIYGRVALTGRPEKFETFVESLKTWFSVSVFSPAPEHFVALFDVINERKRLESFREMGREVLQVLNEPDNLHDSIQHVISVLKTRTGYDAVGIRLQDGDDFPYYGEDGFTQTFLATENTLVEHEGNGRVCRDKDGNVSLECTCGLVISGKTDPNNPLCTPGGSVWTNDSFPLLEIPPADDPRYHPRNQCVHEGHASVALVPIRSKNRIVGLVQFNDRRKGRFSLDAIEILEGIASNIGGALMRKRAEELTLKLEAQLQQAQKMESVGQLAGGVAHDFNNMLTVILGHVNLALMDLDSNQPLYVNMEEIRKAAEHSAALTRQLLAFARKQTIDPRVLDLNEAVPGICKMLKRLIGEGIDLDWQPGEALWPVKVDLSQIEQILTNLCVNARDSITGIGKIIIETENRLIAEDYCARHAGLVPGEYVRITVSDNGCGMDKEIQNRIFEPFFTTKGVGEGTGLGLSSVYGAVTQNNGFINVYSEPGLGTTFTIYLPKYAGKVDHVRPAGPTNILLHGHETILLVEDEPAILEMATMILTKQGYTVLQANTPSSALRLAREHAEKIHLLVSDVVMPEMDGLNLARSLTVLYPQIKHLFMSGYPAGIIAQHGLLNEGQYFIHKPFSLPNFLAKVREVLANDIINP